MKKELKSGILSADKSSDGRPTVGEVNVIAVIANTVDPDETAHCDHLDLQCLPSSL